MYFGGNQILHIMGKGDKKTRRGKIIKGSYGVIRPRKKDKNKTTP
jgi:ribosomal small subunit protein bTHX